MSFLKIENLKVSYRSIKALKGVSLEVEKGEIVTLIGSNGAGKSTLMNSVSGIIPAESGKIIFDGKDITNKPPQKIVKSGLILCPEGRQVFPKMSIYENLMMGAITINSKQEIQNNLEKAYELFPILKERSKQMAGTLSGGEQQMLAVGRALMSSPKLLMLDEPSLGLAPLIIQEIFNLIGRINKMGTTILLVEQNARMALKISHKAYVLETGNVVLSGASDDMRNNMDIQKAYLG
ncbi:MAG: ABC transporter ATP-binding protein [Clostridiales bacterium]|nr:ABC transporter ATP-binding protein [Clostridiales bacterium]